MTQLQDWHQIRLQDTPVSPWKNGGGTTQTLVCWPKPSDWVFRMSVARIDSDGPFSEFKGVDRWFAVLSGEGVVLQFPERRVEVAQYCGSLESRPMIDHYDSPFNDHELHHVRVLCSFEGAIKNKAGGKDGQSARGVQV